jgi:hypothetical protein
MPRVRYGDEKQDWGAEASACHDCRVVRGQVHVAGCDVEECPKCHGQLIGCDCRSKPRKAKAFSPGEEQIIAARRKFKWRQVGFARNGDARFDPPGGRTIVQQDCYKDMLKPREMECFEEPDPTPETKDRYWEFKRLAKPK